jgi:predicted Zn-dependent protease
LARLETDPQPWLNLLEQASRLYVRDPQVESFNAGLRFVTTNCYFLSSEGAVVRSGSSNYQLHVAGHTQAEDGMGLDRSGGYEFRDPKDLPSAQEFLAETSQVLLTLKQLRMNCRYGLIIQD